MTSWEIPQIVFTAEVVTNDTVTSSAFDHLRVMDEHAMEVEVSAFSGDGPVNVLMQGSLDGANWYDLASDDWTALATALLTGNMPARYTRVVAGTNDEETAATITVTITSGLS